MEPIFYRQLRNLEKIADWSEFRPDLDHSGGPYTLFFRLIGEYTSNGSWTKRLIVRL